MINQVMWLASGGEKGLVAMPEWRGELTRRGIRCSHCNGVRPDSIGKLDHVVVEAPMSGHVAGRVSALWGGHVIRHDLAERIGLTKLDRLCISVPLTNAAGRELAGFRYYMERKPRGSWRGTEASDKSVCICKECGRFGYWVGSKPYLLRRYWDGRDGATMICEEVVCTPAFAKSVVGTKQFRTLEAEERELRDEPEDGLPADFDEMVAEIRRRGWVR